MHTEDKHQTWQKDGRRLQTLIPHAEAVMIENARHFVMLKQNRRIFKNNIGMEE